MICSDPRFILWKKEQGGHCNLTTSFGLPPRFYYLFRGVYQVTLSCWFGLLVWVFLITLNFDHFFRILDSKINIIGELIKVPIWTKHKVKHVEIEQPTIYLDLFKVYHNSEVSLLFEQTVFWPIFHASAMNLPWICINLPWICHRLDMQYNIMFDIEYEKHMVTVSC